MRNNLKVGNGYVRYDEDGYDTIDFISPSAHADFAEDVKDDTSYRIVKQVKREATFFDAKNIGEILDRTRYGDTKATATLLDGLKQATGEGESQTGVSMDIEGVAYDMGSVVSGEPECCISMEQPSTKKHIEIVVDLGYSGSTSARTINYRSIGIVNLVSTLQAQGYMIDLYVMSMYLNNKCMHRVKVNTETFCVAQLASVTTTSYWRGLGWLTVEIMRDKKSDGGRDGSSLPKEKLEKYK